MKRYLDRQQIKELNNYIEKNLPKDSMILLKNIVESLNNDMNILGSFGEDIKKKFYHIQYNKMINTRDDIKKKFKEFERFNPVVYEREKNVIIFGFINETYKQEWKYLQSGKCNPTQWQMYFDEFCRNNIVDYLYVSELLEITNVQDFLNKKYAKENLNKDSQILTNKIKTTLDNFYCGVDYDCFQKAAVFYLKTKDERLLNNILNSNI